MAALTVFLSASPADADFAARLRQAIVKNGGRVVSSAPSATSSGALSREESSSLPAGELQTLDSAKAYVAVLSPAAVRSARLRAEAERYAGIAQRQRKRVVVPVQLAPLPAPSGDPAQPDAPVLQGFTPVTGPYGAPELDNILIRETLQRLGLPAPRSSFLAVLLIAGLLALLLLACLGLEVLAPGGGLHFIVNPPTATTAAATATRVPIGTGLLGQYYRSRTINCCVPIPEDMFGAPLFSEVDPQININAGFGKYPDPRLAGGAYAIRWTGKIVPRYSETYTIITHSDDGVRVWINGALLIEDWTVHAEQVDQATIALRANQPYDIRIDYYENDVSGAVMTLQWQSASEPLALVPTSQLYPAQQ